MLLKLERPITIAVAKGYLWTEGLKKLKDIGIEFDDDLSVSRKLSTIDKSGQVTLFKVRSSDVPAYVEQGAADLGMVGKDVLIESQPNVCELMDLKFGACELVLAGLDEISPNDLPHNIRVATKYIRATQDYFIRRNIKAIPIKLYGAIELAPATGLSDIICDLTATGDTLKENDLKIIDTVFESTARLIANPVSLKIDHSVIRSFMNLLQSL